MKSLQELLTIKSDLADEKKDMIKDIISTGEFHLNTTNNFQGETKKVVDTLIKFIND